MYFLKFRNFPKPLEDGLKQTASLRSGKDFELDILFQRGHGSDTTDAWQSFDPNLRVANQLSSPEIWFHTDAVRLIQLLKKYFSDNSKLC